MTNMNTDNSLSSTDTHGQLIGYTPASATITAIHADVVICVRILGCDEDDNYAAALDRISPPMAASAALDWVAGNTGATRENLCVRGLEIWVRGACAVLAIIAPV